MAQRDGVGLPGNEGVVPGNAETAAEGSPLSVEDQERLLKKREALRGEVMFAQKAMHYACRDAKGPIGCQNWKVTNLVQQKAFQRPPLRHLSMTPEA